MILKYDQFITELFDSPKITPTKSKKLIEYDQIRYDTYYGRLNRDYESIYKHSDFQKIWKILERDCDKFLKELESSGSDLLFRGVRQLDSNVSYGMDKRSVRKDRSPKDMLSSVQNIFDSKFYEKFGYKLRSTGVFTTKDPIQAETYSSHSKVKKRKEPFLFFPKGDYRYFWNPNVDDLYTKIEDEIWYYKSEYTEKSNEYLEDMEFDTLDWFKIYGDPNETWNIHSDWKEKGGGNGKFIDGEWVPDKSFDEYMDDLKKQIKMDLDKNTTELVEGYREGGISEITHQEITFICDEYYLVDDAFLFKILKKIKKNRK